VLERVRTVAVEMVNVAVVSFSGTLTLTGVVATAGLPVESMTSTPPAPASAVSVTRPLALVGPSTVEGSSEMDASVGASGEGEGVGEGDGVGEGVGEGVGAGVLGALGPEGVEVPPPSHPGRPRSAATSAALM